MTLQFLIKVARAQSASDLHLEPGLPPALRVRGQLKTFGDPLEASALMEMARETIGPDDWPHFLQRQSWDLSKTLSSVRCRINVFRTARGIGFSIRLLASFEATLESLNLHPELKLLTRHQNGLVLISGPTGSGKSSTLAALIQEINLHESRHIITIESPIEYSLRPRLSFIRQREVGRDTPSFEQALLDALREDPDVLMVGEMRDPETMRLTLNAAETGHLVFATLHSSTCAEGLQRITSAFPSEIQSSVRAQLADCLLAAVSQRLHYQANLKMLLPELEILVGTHPVKHFVRTGEFFKMSQAMETGADQGMWTRERYRAWMEKNRDWNHPNPEEELQEAPLDLPSPMAVANPSDHPAQVNRSSASDGTKTFRSGAPSTKPGRPPTKSSTTKPIEIEPVEGGLDKVLREFEDES